MAKKKTFISDGPNCPRCSKTSKIYIGKNGKQSAYCLNSSCATKSFPAEGGRKSSDRIKAGDGPPCPRCLSTTIAWKHAAGWIPTPGKGYYTHWYECQNNDCHTKQLMPPEAYVPGKKLA